jgi:hypothetical protein
MKKFLPLALVLVALTGSSSLQAREISPVPSYGDVKEINLRGQQGTLLRIFPNGSGALTTASNDKVSTFPRHTFAFMSIYQTLLPGLLQNNEREKAIAYVGPSQTLSDVSYRFYVRDQYVIDRLVSEAHAKTM